MGGNMFLRPSQGTPKNSKIRDSSAYEGITGTYWSAVIHDAAERNIAFKLTIQKAWQVYVAQKGLCALSGVPINFAKNGREFRSGLNTASLNRIDSHGIYEPSNIQWVHRVINRMKGELDDNEFKTWCQHVYERDIILPLILG